MVETNIKSTALLLRFKALYIYFCSVCLRCDVFYRESPKEIELN